MSSCHFVQGAYRSRCSSYPLVFGELRLHMQTTRQRVEHINVGVISINGKVHQRERKMLGQWIVMSRIAVLGGFCGKNTGNCVRELAMEAGALGNGPCSQQLLIQNNRVREWEARPPIKKAEYKLEG